MRTPRKVALVLVLSGALVSAPLAVAAGTSTTATCTASPALTNGATTQSFDVHCSVPKLSASTVTVTSTTTVTAPAQTVTSTQTVTATASPTSTATPSATASPTATARPMPAVPHITVAALEAQTGQSTFVQACRKMTSYAVIDLPAGFNQQIVGATDINGMGLYCPYALGFSGDGAASLTLAPGSVTSASSQYFQLVRQSQGIDDNQTTGPRPYGGVNSGWTLNGTDQANATDQYGRTQPMLYLGLVNYIQRGSWWSNVKVTGIPGNGSYPPAETFGIEDYKGDGNYYTGIEVDGRNAAGVRVGGAPFGSSGGKHVTVEDSWFHDSRSSSLTFSYAGSEASGQNTDTVTLTRVRVENNANHDSAAGHRMAGINFEGVRGAVLLDHVTILLDTVTQAWDLNHVAIASQMIDNPNFTIIEPTWNALAPWTNGAFVVAEPNDYGAGNKQTSAPNVVKNGVTLTPYFYAGPPPAGFIAPVDPARQFIVRTGS